MTSSLPASVSSAVTWESRMLLDHSCCRPWEWLSSPGQSFANPGPPPRGHAGTPILSFQMTGSRGHGDGNGKFAFLQLRPWNLIPHTTILSENTALQRALIWQDRTFLHKSPWVTRLDTEVSPSRSLSGTEHSKPTLGTGRTSLRNQWQVNQEPLAPGNTCEGIRMLLRVLLADTTLSLIISRLYTLKARIESGNPGMRDASSSVSLRYLPRAL